MRSPRRWVRTKINTVQCSRPWVWAENLVKGCNSNPLRNEPSLQRYDG